MNKWYRSSLTKGILIVLSHVFAVAAVISLIWIAAYPGLTQDILSGKKAKTYQESEGFSNQILFDSEQIWLNIRHQAMLETDGKLDEKRIVDVRDYVETGIISNEEKNGLAYYLGDLDRWNTAMDSGEVLNGDYGVGPDDSIIVCQRADGTYQYYYYSEFKALIESEELSFVTERDGLSSAEILNNLNAEYYAGTENASFSSIKDAEDKVVYVDCWNYDGYWIEEKYAPIGAKDILEVANNNPEWNGKLSKAYEQVDNAVRSIGASMDYYRSSNEDWQEGDTNLCYLYADLDAKRVYTNREAYKNFNSLEENIKKMKAAGQYIVVRPKLADFETNMNGAEASVWKSEAKMQGTNDKQFVYAAAVDTTYPIHDEYYSQNQLYSKYAPQIRMVVLMGCLSVLLFLVAIIWLTVAAGRSSKDDELHLHPFDRWKTELAAAVVIGLWMIPTFLFAESWINYYRVTEDHTIFYTSELDILNNIPQLLFFGGLAVFTCALFLLGYLSLVRRVKAKTVWKNSLLRWLIGFFRQLFEHIHCTWKTILLFGGFVIIHWIAYAASYNGFWFMVMLIAEATAGIYLLRRAIGRQKIRTGIEHIASGEVNYKIPLHGLIGDQLIIAERVNAIGDGLDAAVEASMKNERLKTDLITNVSHDIKTPLTSIINYVDLLKRENFTDPKILGYLDILEAKAQRLKTLTEDVVEASKVSSGNITLEFMNINLVEMIQQTSGEFEEKFSKRNLTEILQLPEEEAVIRVDGRRMWRVLENIYNNAAKYAMEGTRIYADLSVTETEVIFCLKNISEQPLNIRADELTERFIRGDISRSTEGSGLGLSIAKNLTEMQGGKFDLYLDGDLFRVTITFPRMVKIIQ